MTTKRITTVFFYIVVTIGMLFALILLPGCQAARELDRIIWTNMDPDYVPPEPDSATQPAAVPADTPPILSIAASILSLGGFTGLAAWLRKTAKNGKANADTLQAQITLLQTQLINQSESVSQIRALFLGKPSKE